MYLPREITKFDLRKGFIYIEEIGEHQLEKFNPPFPAFTLCGILVSDIQLRPLEEQVKTFNLTFFDTDEVILHSRDIRKREKAFSILQ